MIGKIVTSSIYILRHTTATMPTQSRHHPSVIIMPRTRVPGYFYKGGHLVRAPVLARCRGATLEVLL